MELRLSAPRTITEAQLGDLARLHNAYARIKWATPLQIRFELVCAPLSPTQAPFDTQSRIIGALLALDPPACIRTAKAAYHGLADFKRQTKGVTA